MAAMPLPTVAQIVESCRALSLLNASQLNELSDPLHQPGDNAKAFLTELVRRGWLTPFQMEGLLSGMEQNLRVGPYVLLQRLGQGGMGNVFKARHEFLNRVVALKVIRKDVDGYPENARRFRREIQATARLSHPNIVVAHDAGFADGFYYFAMEFIEGTDLSRLIKEQGPLPITQACDYIRRAALGLQHAFEQGLVHRDIKPANLVLTNDADRIKIVDMGLVCLGEGSDEALTATGTVIGTADYLAPEQATNSHSVDIRADLYSLGCSFYFLLTGSHPFPGGTLLEKVFKHLHDQPQPIRQFRPELPEGVVSVMERLLAKSPDDRFQRPIELAEALEPFCDPASEPASPGTGAAKHASPPAAPAAEVGNAPPNASGGDSPVIAETIPPSAPSASTSSNTAQLRHPSKAPQAEAAIAPVLLAAAAPAPVAAAPAPVANPAGSTPAPAAAPEPPPKFKFQSRRRLLLVAAMGMTLAFAGMALWRSWYGGKSTALPAVKNSIGMDLVRIPAGHFTMGATATEVGRQSDEGPPHKVLISRSFYVAAHETTVAQFRAFVESTHYPTEAERKETGAQRWDASAGVWKLDPKCTWRNPGWPLADNQPVVCVCRNDAVAFCYWLSHKEGKVYRLPTEAEWEYVCRAGTSTPYGGGGSLSLRDANFTEASAAPGSGPAGMPRPVGSFAPNAWGLFDMHGNAWEWCGDGFSPTYYGNSPERDPAAPGSSFEGVLRGGSWSSGALDCRSARRCNTLPGRCRNDTGFRVVREAGAR
jgi:formylglycine-generating enzyme required for sulfatase activity